MHDANSDDLDLKVGASEDPYAEKKEAPKPKPKSIPEQHGMPRGTKILMAVTTAVVLATSGYAYYVFIGSKPKLELLPEGASHFKAVNNRAFTYQYEGEWYMFYAPNGKRKAPGMIRKLDEKDPFHPNNRKGKKPTGIKNLNEI
jgi:hypothetical protein